MTERGRGSLHREPDALAIGPSAIAWDGDALVVRIDETTFPVPSRLRGTVRLHPQVADHAFETLDGHARHRWWPIAPLARVEVELERPALRWSGTGYHDANAGDEPLEAGFVDWDWSRAPLGREAAVLYDMRRRDGSEHTLALRFRPDGSVEHLSRCRGRTCPERSGACAAGRRARWPARQRAPDPGGHAVLRPLGGRHASARAAGDDHAREPRPRPVQRRWVRMLLPFRMPRRR